MSCSTILSGIMDYIGPNMLFLGVGLFNILLSISLKVFDKSLDAEINKHTIIKE